MTAGIPKYLSQTLNVAKPLQFSFNDEVKYPFKQSFTPTLLGSEGLVSREKV